MVKKKKVVKKSKIKSKLATSDSKFMGSTLTEWVKMNFFLGDVLQEWTLKEISELEEIVMSIDGGYVLGNLDFAICLPLDEAEVFLSEPFLPPASVPEVKAIFEFRIKRKKA